MFNVSLTITVFFILRFIIMIRTYQVKSLIVLTIMTVGLFNLPAISVANSDVSHLPTETSTPCTTGDYCINANGIYIPHYYRCKSDESSCTNLGHGNINLEGSMILQKNGWLLSLSIPEFDQNVQFIIPELNQSIQFTFNGKGESGFRIDSSTAHIKGINSQGCNEELNTSGQTCQNWLVEMWVDINTLVGAVKIDSILLDVQGDKSWQFLGFLRVASP
jgi:hypothetical protein